MCCLDTPRQLRSRGANGRQLIVEDKSDSALSDEPGPSNAAALVSRRSSLRATAAIQRQTRSTNRRQRCQKRRRDPSEDRTVQVDVLDTGVQTRSQRNSRRRI